MLAKIFNASKKEDICPNCGTACFATDVLCPNCRENLDDLFEKLPDPKEADDFFKMASKNLPFMYWLTPSLLLLSPFFVSLLTVLLIALNMVRVLDQNFLPLFIEDVLYSTLVSSGFSLISAIPLFLCSTAFIRAKIGQRPVMILATLFSILSVITFSLGVLNANIMSAIRFQRGFGFPVPAGWVYFVIAGGIILIILNLIVLIGQAKTA